MSEGTEHIEAALNSVQNASDAIAKLDGVEESWGTEAVARLTSCADRLRASEGRFFLKTKMCLPFARKCEETAKTLDTLLAEQVAQPTADAQQQLTAALEALDKAARTLDERSQMQGMTIT